jgi:hypothetical protein
MTAADYEPRYPGEPARFEYDLRVNCEDAPPPDPPAQAAPPRQGREPEDWIAKAFAAGDWAALVRQLPPAGGLRAADAPFVNEALDLDALRVALSPGPAVNRLANAEALDLDALRALGEAGPAVNRLADGDALDLDALRDR